MRLNSKTKAVHLKIVYYGPGLSGKTTNLVHLHAALPSGRRGELVQLDTETERTLFFDYFPFSLGSSGRYQIKVDFFTVPGQSFYQATRRAVLDGVDGVVFVADSHPDREEANLLAHQDMVASLEERDRSLADLPHVYQWNKRDLPRATPTQVMERLLNPEGVPSFEAVAVDGRGVFESQDALVKRVVEHIATWGLP